MGIRKRAIQAEDKRERREAILDAAARLLVRSPGRIPGMADVADEGGLAKGTVYLYFPSKEALLLAVHERHVDGYFRALMDRLGRDERTAVADVLALTHVHLVDPPLVLALAARCFGLIAQGTPTEPALAFRQRMAERIAKGGAALERHWRELGSGQGAALLRQSYALIIGLWHMHGYPAQASAALDTAYRGDLDRALAALWNGSLGGGHGSVLALVREDASRGSRAR